MAVTLSEEVASKELISDFETTISSIKGITQEDYNTLLSSVAYESAKRIETFVDKSVTEPEQAAIEAQKIIERERKRRNNEQARLKEATVAVKKEQEAKSELRDRLTEIENDLVEFSGANIKLRESREEDKTTIEKLQEQIAKYKRATKKWITSLVFFIIIVGLAFAAWRYWSLVVNGLDWLWKAILGVGAFWSFGSFIINLIKALRNK
jgi:cation transport ATPase